MATRQLLILATALAVAAAALSSRNVRYDIFSIVAEDLDADSKEELIELIRAGLDTGPPPHEEVAKMARYVVHYTDWGSLATISSRDPIVGFPFANLFSFSDGSSVDKSSGVPYFYATGLDMSFTDLEKDNRTSLSVSLAQGTYCQQQKWDPEDPRCTKVVLSGQIVKVEANSDEENFAKDALFTRHPDMAGWPTDHGWFFAKLNISNILVLDYFGGAKNVATDDYFKATPN